MQRSGGGARGNEFGSSPVRIRGLTLYLFCSIFDPTQKEYSHVRRRERATQIGLGRLRQNCPVRTKVIIPRK
jgi:hypothetical protein